MYSPEELMKSNIGDVRKVIKFFLCKSLDPKFHDEVKQKLLGLDIFKIGTEANNINLGIFSMKHYGFFFGKYNRRTVSLILNKLVSTYLLEVFFTDAAGFENYMINDRYAKAMNKLGLIENVLLGFNFIIEKYRPSVYKIINCNENGDLGIGTGFLIRFNEDLHIITNNHVLEEAVSLNVLTVDDVEISTNTVHRNKEKDLALLKIDLPIDEIDKYLLNNPSFPLSTRNKPLIEIITIGYPSIPMTKEAYQIYHKGEINSAVEDYKGNKLFLISAKTSSGNSGSPVIEESGMVLGIVTQELFNKKELEEKGKLPYYAVIPSSEIQKFIDEYLEILKK